MRNRIKILVSHPRHWTDRSIWPKDVEIRHVSLGGDIPRRINGQISYDGIGDVVDPKGLEALDYLFRNWKPDVFLFGIHIGLNRSIVETMRRIHPAKLVMWYTDQRPTISKFVREYDGILDMLLVTNRDANDHAMYAGVVPVVKTFYDGVDPTEYWPKPIKPVKECFFGGNNFWILQQEMLRKKINTAPWIAKFTGAEFRNKFLRAVAKQFDLEIRGEWGWTDFPIPILKPMFHPKYLDAMRNAKIVLNTINVQRYGLLTRRFFRSIASGRLFMTEYVAGLEETFENHKHLVWFRGLEEGLDLIRYYLDHEDIREKIAITGRTEIVHKHTWKHRLPIFVNLCRRSL